MGKSLAVRENVIVLLSGGSDRREQPQSQFAQDRGFFSVILYFVFCTNIQYYLPGYLGSLVGMYECQCGYT